MSYIIEILVKTLRNKELDHHEKTFLDDWKRQSDNNATIYKKLEKYWDHKLKVRKDTKEDVWNKLELFMDKETSIEKKTSRKIHFNKLYYVAASVLLVLFFFYYQEKQDINPKESPIAEVSYITRENQKGEKRNITLSDGTFIKLNAESKLKFPDKFSGNTREVYLTGEAFFDVKKDTSSPFIIHTKDISTVVKGTSFNIRAFEDDQLITVSVVTGLVELESHDSVMVSLKPHEEAIVNVIDNNVKKESFELEEISWRDNILCFKDQHLGEIITTLERWYGVEFILEDENVKMKNGFSGTFKNESLREVMENLSFAGHFKFRIEKDKIYIN
ncbi:FecR family protein [Chondrinema litorale]|uniref:FecR family protein n=1 Tax=Chondrinema litorale TaxID=2994555 RepID=UPI00254348F8|nr:FecR family protein [Chondrinema litorale]UZR96844.1 FecR family protein [Chondrinema litorale]